MIENYCPLVFSFRLGSSLSGEVGRDLMHLMIHLMSKDLLVEMLSDILRVVEINGSNGYLKRCRIPEKRPGRGPRSLCGSLKFLR